MDNLTQTPRDRQIAAGMAAVFPPERLLARDALLFYAARCLTGAWPDVKCILRFACAYCVNPQKLGAIVGIISFRRTEPPQFHQRAELSQNWPLWTMPERRSPRSRLHPLPDNGLKLHAKVSSTKARCGLRWNMAMIVKARLRH